MKGLIDLVENYWIWMLVIAFIAIFTYIGYYVDKKGYLDKDKKEKGDDKLVDIDELSVQKDESVKVEKNVEEDLSSSFDVMPEVKQEESSNDIPDELFAPFGDKVFEKKPNDVVEVVTKNDKEPEKEVNDVSEIVSDNYDEKYKNLDEIKNNAKDINVNNKKDVVELMKDDNNQIDLNFEVEGSTSTVKNDNIFANSKNKDKKKKKEETVDEMWKF